MQDLILRERTEIDSEFFIKLFCEIKSSELHLDSWPELIRQQMLAMQFHAFEQCMRAEFPNYIDYVILIQSEKAGRFQIEKNDSYYRIINISLLSTHRNKGLGTSILTDLLSEADRKGIPVFLDVDVVNPALHLYLRMGFKIVRQDEIRYSMKYSS